MIKAVHAVLRGADDIVITESDVGAGSGSGQRESGPQRTRLINGVAATSRYHPRSSGLMRMRVVSTYVILEHPTSR